MGGGASKYADDEEYSRLRQEIPDYCVDADLSHDQAELLKRSWAQVLSNSTPFFISMKSDKSTSEFPYETCLQLVGQTFYNNFFQLNPDARNFYHADMSNQQRSLVQFIDMILLVCNDKEVFLSKMEILADIHYKKGVTAIEYNSFGRALFMTLEECLGAESFDQETRLAWVTAYSMIVRIMIAFIIKTESRGFKPQKIGHQDSMMVGKVHKK